MFCYCGVLSTGDVSTVTERETVQCCLAEMLSGNI